VIFCGLSNISSAVFQYRLNTNSIGNALVQNFKVGSPFVLLADVSGSSFSSSSSAGCHGISPMPCTRQSHPALPPILIGYSVAHLVGYNMQWASTIKEVEVSQSTTCLNLTHVASSRTSSKSGQRCGNVSGMSGSYHGSSS